MSDAIRLIVEGETRETSFRQDGSWNMAVDETLLHSATESGLATLRFYGWQTATLSLGYFQTLSERAAHAASKMCNVVRRASGGGAILHDRELTYAFATPVRSQLGAVDELYFAFHETLVATLDVLGAQCRLHTADDGLTDDPFLCFQRRASGDVTCGGFKVAGSAQRRRKGAVLQHGSILLAQSTFAPELPGLRETAEIDVAADTVIRKWLPKLMARLKTDHRVGELSDTEKGAAQQIRADKFAQPGWTGRR